MPLTLTAPPTVVEGARSYAEHSGMTLEALILAYLESVAERERESGSAALTKHPSAIVNPISFQDALGDEIDRGGHQCVRVPLFGTLKDKIKFIAADFDEPLEDFAEYM